MLAFASKKEVWSARFLTFYNTKRSKYVSPKPIPSNSILNFRNRNGRRQSSKIVRSFSPKFFDDFPRLNGPSNFSNWGPWFREIYTSPATTNRRRKSPRNRRPNSPTRFPCSSRPRRPIGEYLAAILIANELLCTCSIYESNCIARLGISIVSFIVS